MKIAVICWCLLSIALALPIHREKHGSKQEIKGAEVNSVQLGKEAEAGKEKTEKEQSPPGESDKTKEEKEHSPPAESDKPKGEKGHSSELQSDKAKEGKTEIHNDDLETEYQATEEDGVSSDESEKIDKQEDAKPMVQAKGAEAVKEKSDKNAEVNSDNQDKEVEAEKKKMDHPSPAGNGKPKDDKVSGDKPSSKSTRSLKTLDTENMSKYVREVSPRSIVFDMRGVDQEAQDAENSPTAKLEAAADDSQVSLSSDMTDDDQEGAENYLTVKLKAPEEDSQNSPASDVTETDQESAPSSAEAEENTEPQVSGESKPSADDPGNFMDSVEPEVSSAED